MTTKLYNGKPFPKIVIEINSPLEAQYFAMLASIDNPLEMFISLGTREETNEIGALVSKMGDINIRLTECLGGRYYPSDCASLVFDRDGSGYFPLKFDELKAQQKEIRL